MNSTDENPWNMKPPDGPGSSTSSELAAWFIRAVRAYRGASTGGDHGSTPPGERFLSWGDRLQITVVWAKEPEVQFLIYTKFDDLPDLQVVVRGPVPIWSVFDEFDSLLKDPKWDRAIGSADPAVLASPDRTQLRSALESWVIADLSNVQTGLFNPKAAGGGLGGARIGTDCSFSLYHGDISRHDPARYGRTVARAEGTLAPATSSVPQAGVPRAEGIQSAVTYFYPPIYVGTVPSPRSIRDRFTKGYLLAKPDRVADIPLGKYRLIVQRNGYALVVGASNVEAAELLNTLFSISRLNGIPAVAVPVVEVAGAEFDSKTDDLRSWWEIYRSPRWTTPVRHGWRPDSPHQNPAAYSVAPPLFQSCIETLRKVLPTETLCRDLRLVLDAATFEESGQHEPSFALSWIVIERWLRKQWELHVAGLPVSGRSKDALGGWDAHHQVEALAMVKVLSVDDAEVLRGLLTKRNRLMHRGEVILRGTALASLSYADRFVKAELDHL